MNNSSWCSVSVRAAAKMKSQPSRSTAVGPEWPRRQATIRLQPHRLVRGTALGFLFAGKSLQPIRLDAFACGDTAVVLRIIALGLRVNLGELLVGANDGVLYSLGRVGRTLALSGRFVGPP